MLRKKIATNIPKYLIEEATRVTGLNQTQALIEGLKELITRKKRLALLAHRGKLSINVNTDVSRKRSRI